MELKQLETFLSGTTKYFYYRKPEFIAKKFLEILGNKKVLLYGIGKHTQEFLKYLQNKSNIIGIIKEYSIPEGYMEYDFDDIKVIEEMEVKNIDFDYIVLLGAWNEKNIEKLANSLDLEIDKIFLPYKNLLIQEYIKSEVFNFNNVTKPIIIHFAWDSKNDIFSESAENMSKSFCIIKIYLNEFHYENKNDIYFNKIFRLYNIPEEIKLYTVLEILNYIKPKIIVCTKPTAKEVFFDYLLMKHKPINSKFIFAPWGDIITYKATSLTDQELCETCNCNQDELEVMKYCEKKLILESDAVFSSLLGVYLNEVLEKEAKKVLTSIFFMHSRYYTFKENNIDNIRICNAGSLSCAEDKSLIWALAMDHSGDYKVILEQGISLDVYTFYHDKLKCFEQMQKQYQNFKLYFSHEHWSLPNTLKEYHFGLVWSNLLPEVKEKLYPGPQSVFVAKTLTYIASGIPIIVHKDAELVANFVQQHNIGLIVDKNDLKNMKKIINNCDYAKLKENIKLLQVNIGQNELENIEIFFKELINEK